MHFYSNCQEEENKHEPEKKLPENTPPPLSNTKQNYKENEQQHQVTKSKTVTVVCNGKISTIPHSSQQPSAPGPLFSNSNPQSTCSSEVQTNKRTIPQTNRQSKSPPTSRLLDGRVPVNSCPEPTNTKDTQNKHSDAETDIDDTCSTISDTSHLFALPEIFSDVSPIKLPTSHIKLPTSVGPAKHPPHTHVTGHLQDDVTEQMGTLKVPSNSLCTTETSFNSSYNAEVNMSHFTNNVGYKSGGSNLSTQVTKPCIGRGYFRDQMLKQNVQTPMGTGVRRPRRPKQ